MNLWRASYLVEMMGKRSSVLQSRPAGHGQALGPVTRASNSEQSYIACKYAIAVILLINRRGHFLVQRAQANVQKDQVPTTP